jgi:hypothetical protein
MFIPRDYREWSGFTSTNLFFTNCLIRNKQLCPYGQNVHFHYTDLRRIHYENKLRDIDIFSFDEVVKAVRYYLKTYMAEPSDETLKLLKVECLGALSYLELLSDLDVILSLILEPVSYKLPHLIVKSNTIESLQKILQFQALTMTVERKGVLMHRTAASLLKLSKTNPDIASRIKTFSRKKAYELYDLIQPLMKILSKYLGLIIDGDISNNTLTYNRISKMMDTINLYMTRISSTVIVDPYILSRILFKSRETEEIIIYAGGNHISNILLFFEAIFNIKYDINIPETEGSSCVAIPYSKLNKYLDLRGFNEIAEAHKAHTFGF